MHIHGSILCPWRLSQLAVVLFREIADGSWNINLIYLNQQIGVLLSSNQHAGHCLYLLPIGGIDNDPAVLSKLAIVMPKNREMKILRFSDGLFVNESIEQILNLRWIGSRSKWLVESMISFRFSSVFVCISIYADNTKLWIPPITKAVLKRKVVCQIQDLRI